MMRVRVSGVLVIALMLSWVVPIGQAAAHENLKPRPVVLVDVPLFVYGWFETDRTSEGYTAYKLAAYQPGLTDGFEGTRVIVVKRLVYGLNLDFTDHIVEETILPSDALTFSRDPQLGSTVTFNASLPLTGVWDLIFYSGYGSKCTASGPGYNVDTNPCYWMGVLEGKIDGKTPELHPNSIWGGNATGRLLLNPEF